jgi:hypothetical protein
MVAVLTNSGVLLNYFIILKNQDTITIFYFTTNLLPNGIS